MYNKEHIYRYRQTPRGREIYNSLQRKYSKLYYEKNAELISQKKRKHYLFRKECERMRTILRT